MTPDPREAIEGRDWWHDIEVAPGVVTPGWWDLRPTAERMPWPRSLEGKRCLDIGSMDCFWAFELERAGAGEVVAIDLVDPRRHDAPVARRRREPIPAQFHRGGTFASPPSSSVPGRSTEISASTTSIRMTSASST